MGRTWDFRGFSPTIMGPGMCDEDLSFVAFGGSPISEEIRCCRSGAAGRVQDGSVAGIWSTRLRL